MRKLLDQAAETLGARDLLAIERTMLGNTRTVLAMIRTAIAMLAVGIGFLRFLEHPAIHITAHALIGGSFFVFAFGLFNFWYYRRSIKRIIQRKISKS